MLLDRVFDLECFDSAALEWFRLGRKHVHGELLDGRRLMRVEASQVVFSSARHHLARRCHHGFELVCQSIHSFCFVFALRFDDRSLLCFTVFRLGLPLRARKILLVLRVILASNPVLLGL